MKGETATKRCWQVVIYVLECRMHQLNQISYLNYLTNEGSSTLHLLSISASGVCHFILITTFDIVKYTLWHESKSLAPTLP